MLFVKLCIVFGCVKDFIYLFKDIVINLDK